MIKAPHIVTIYALPTGTHAVLEPGILEAEHGDVIEFRNQTSSVAQLVVAQERILERVPPMVPQDIDGGRAIQRTVDATVEPNTYEYQVVVTLQNGKRVFAIGASTPKIIIRSSSDAG